MNTWKECLVEKKLDGSFVIQANGHPYNVCPPEIDPDGAYDFKEVSEFWEGLSPDNPLRQEEEPPLLTDLIYARCAEINLIKGGRAAVMPFGGFHFDTDIEGKLNILGKVSEIDRSGGHITTVQWITHDNEMIELSAEDFCVMAESIPAHEEACVFTAFRHKAAVSALTDAEAIRTYDITEGWP